MHNNEAQKPLSFLKLVLMCVVAIDSLKNLPINAQYGFSLIIFYLIAIITFFIPSAIVSAELAAALPEAGGVYVWVKHAFGKAAAFFTVWIQWMIAIVWYPSILAFIATTFAYLFDKKLALNKEYLFFSTVILFWFASYCISKGVKLGSYISGISAIIGVIIPMMLISILGIYWIYQGNELHTHTNPLFISLNQEHLRLFITLIYSLMGIEMIATHASDVKNPQRNYPVAIFVSSWIILMTMIPASLAIAIVIPHDQIGLINGVIESFLIFFNAFHLEWMQPIIILMICIGSFGIFYTWALNATRCINIAADDGCLHPALKHPKTQLILQALIFTLLSALFILLPSINTVFWYLTAAAAELALIYYFMIFTAAIYLRHKKPLLHRPFTIVKTLSVAWIICLMPLLTLILCFFFGFIPPTENGIVAMLQYDFFLCIIILGSLISAKLAFNNRENVLVRTVLLVSKNTIRVRL